VGATHATINHIEWRTLTCPANQSCHWQSLRAHLIQKAEEKWPLKSLTLRWSPAAEKQGKIRGKKWVEN